METIAVKSHHLSISYFLRMVIVHGLFALLKVFLILFGNTALFFEEAQYWLWSNYLDLSYYSKPPLIAYTNYISTAILGNTELAIRINAIICGFLIAIIVYRFTEKLTNDTRKAFWSSVFLLAFPYFWLISFFFTTDSLVTLFWIWGLYSLYQASHGHTIYWISTGLAVGLGLLSKYVMVLFWPVASLYLLAFKKSRLGKPYPYLAFLLSVVLVFPVVLWNIDHEWIGIFHVIGLTETVDNHVNLGQTFLNIGTYIGGQFVFWIVIMLAPLIYTIRKISSGKSEDHIYLLFVPPAVIFIIFGLLSFHSPVEVNWTFFVLPPLAVLAGVIPVTSPSYVRRRMILIGSVMTVLFSIPMIGKLIEIPAYMNPGRRILGWEEMSESIGEIINEQEGDILLVADSYKTASMLTFYLQGQPVVHSFSPTKRMNQFDLWEDRMKTDSNVQTLFIGESEPKQLHAFGKKLEHYQVLRPYNDSEGTHYYVILFDAFYGMEGYSKSKY